MLQELQQEVVASVGHDVFRNAGGENNTLKRRKSLDTWVSSGQRWVGQLSSSLWDAGGWRFLGTHVVVMISSLVLRISNTGPWYLQGTEQWGGRTQREAGDNWPPHSCTGCILSPCYSRDPWASPSPRGAVKKGMLKL